VGASFKDVPSNDTNVHINHIVPDTNVVGIDWENPLGWILKSQLMSWDGTSYSTGTYYWTGEVPQDIKEMLGPIFDCVYNNIWVNNEYEPVDVSFPAGSAMWIQDDSQKILPTASVTVYGEVLENDKATIPKPAKTPLTMFSNTLPIAFNINEMILSNVEGIEWDNPLGWILKSQLLFWDGTSYSTGTYYWTGEVPQDIREMLEPVFDCVYNNIWVNNEYEPVDVVIKVGQGFWIQNTKASNASTITFPGL